MSEKPILGIHHVTALTSDAQKNLEFYAGILGLRLVKKTVNFDAPEIYHLYYGNADGSPGTILTFFPYEGIARGRKGKGQLTVISFSVPKASLEYWKRRFDKFRISYRSPQQRMNGEIFIYFEDFDGLGLELVGCDEDARQPFSYGNISLEHSIRGFYGVALSEEGYERTAGLLSTHLNHQLIHEQGNRFRYSASGKSRDFVDVLCSPDVLYGLPGAGTVHHIAFATANSQTQKHIRSLLLDKGYNVTPILDREYFQSIYFREPGGVLFEVATLLPGFSVDEDTAHLGTSLKLPPWQEKNRSFIERELPYIHLDNERFKD